MTTPDDAESIERTRQGDARAFETVVQLHFHAVHAYARRALGDADLAQETAQETFVRAFKYCASYDASTGSVRGWLLGIATNRIRDARRARRRDPASLDPTFAAELIESDVTGLEALAKSDVRTAVRTALRALPEEHREVLELRYLAELSYEDVAAALGITAGAARLRALRARDVLARRIAYLAESGTGNVAGDDDDDVGERRARPSG